MVRICIAVAAAVLGVASAAAYAEEVKLNDQDRIELRQRADSLRSSNMMGRDHGAMHSTDHAMKTKTHGSKKHSKKHAHHGKT